MSLRIVTVLLLVLAALVTACTTTQEQPAPTDSEAPSDAETTLDRALIEPFLALVGTEEATPEGRDSNLNADVWEVTVDGEPLTVFVFADEAGAQDAIPRMSAMHLWSVDRYVVTYAGENETLIATMNDLFG